MNTQELAQERVDTGHFGWLRQLTKTERRTFIGCKVGYALDAMDTQFLSFVIPTLIATGMDISLLVASFYGGTGLLIVVSVALDLVQKIDSHLVMRNKPGMLDSEEA